MITSSKIVQHIPIDAIQQTDESFVRIQNFYFHQLCGHESPRLIEPGLKITKHGVHQKFVLVD